VAPPVDLSLTGDTIRRGGAREPIIQAVHDLLNEGASFSELSVGRIADRAGVSRATFYLHFADKRALLGALAQRELTQWREVAEPLFANPDAGYDELLRTVEDMFAMWDDQRAVLAALIELAEYDDDARAAWRGVIESVGAMIAQYSLARKDVAVEDAELSGRMIAWMAERVCHQMLASASKSERAALAEALTETIWRARKPNP
jgi:AcrR family transcriptional regulator